MSTGDAKDQTAGDEKKKEDAGTRPIGRDTSRRLHPFYVIVIAAVMLVAGVAIGYAVHPSSSSTSSGGAPEGSDILSITAAGTLDTAFPALGWELYNETPMAPPTTATQEYEGSLSALANINTLHEKYDVAAAADFRLIPELLENGSFASWEAVFASNPEVLVYVPSEADSGGPLYGINSSNWGWKIQAPGIVMGVANASTDPNGYNEIFSMELQGLVFNGSLASVYSHFFSGSPGSYAKPTAASSVQSETNFANLIGSDTIQVAITYRSYAYTHHLANVSMDPRVGLGNLTAADEASYSQASTTILGSSGSATDVVKGAPVLFAATVPTNAPNQTLGDLFVHLVLSPQGASELASLGFSPISPGYWQATTGTVAPAYIAPETEPLPAALSADLPST